MINVVKDIENNCEDLTPQGIVRFLVDRGDLSIYSNYYREVYFFYKELRKDHSHAESKAVTVECFSLSSSTFKRILRKFKGS